jgi:drug/metabolite transporter (DMT)-like permease
MQGKKILVYVAALLAVSFWAFSYVWMKVVYQYYNPLTTMFIRLTLSSVLLFTILHLMGKTEKVKREHYLSFFILSFFSPFCYFLGESFGLLWVTPTIAAVVIATIPVMSPLLGFMAFGERLSLLNISGFIVSFAGVIIMVLDKDLRFSASPLGLLLLLFAVASALVNIVYLKRLTRHYSSATIIKTQNLIGALLFMPLFLIFDYQSFITVKPTGELIGALVMLSVFASTLAFMFYTISVREIGVARAAVFTNLIPVFTAVFSFFFWGEIIDMNKIAGIIIVIAGLLLSQWAGFMRKMRGEKSF